MDQLIPALEVQDPNNVRDAIESFLVQNGVCFSGPATIRLTRREDEEEWLAAPRLVLEADLRYDLTDFSSLDTRPSFDLSSPLNTNIALDILAQPFPESTPGGLMNWDAHSGLSPGALFFPMLQDVAASTAGQSEPRSSQWLLEDVDMDDIDQTNGPSRRASATSDFSDQLQSPGSYFYTSSSNDPIPESTPATSVINTPMSLNFPSPESVSRMPSHTASAAITPTIPTTPESSTPSRSRTSSSRSPVLSSKAHRVVVSASRQTIREDYLQYLKSEVSIWASSNQFLVDPHTQPGQASTETSPYADLEVAYSTVCQLDSRIYIDTIRSRVALIRLHREYVRICESWDDESVTHIGRGKTSFIIDHILGRIHRDWDSLDKTVRETLRAKFHSQKRFGKRWLLMVEALGPGILLICSQKLANTIRNSAVTIQMLKGICDRVDRTQSKATRVLQVLKPLANSIFNSHTVDSGEVGKMIQALEIIEEESPSHD